MAKKTSFDSLSKAELEVMNILWDAGTPMTTTAIREQNNKWSSNTYLFRVIHKLEEKGFIKDAGEIQIKTKPSRIYKAIVSREEYQAYFFDTFCDGSMQNFLSGLVKTRNSRTDFIDDLKAWLDDQEE